VYLQDGYRIDWAPMYLTTTIVAATVIQVINTVAHTTSLTTIHNKIPAGYTIPTETNAQGTRTAQIAYTRFGSTLTIEL